MPKLVYLAGRQAESLLRTRFSRPKPPTERARPWACVVVAWRAPERPVGDSTASLSSKRRANHSLTSSLPESSPNVGGKSALRGPCHSCRHKSRCLRPIAIPRLGEVPHEPHDPVVFDYLRHERVNRFVAPFVIPCFVRHSWTSCNAAVSIHAKGSTSTSESAATRRPPVLPSIFRRTHNRQMPCPGPPCPGIGSPAAWPDSG